MPDSNTKPSTLGGFELVAALGKGGMGTVLKARQVSMDRLVALKILPKKLAENEAFVQRFLREARSAAKLRHPNIVQAYDVGQADGYYFFAMEFVDGEALSEIIRRDGPLEPSRALDVMKQVTSALAAAHKEGIVHRDIKPSNIMLDKEGQVRVTDFGLAKRAEGDVEVTADGAVLGTPAYVAPEMAKGGEADGRSDLYSLGATIFCALAGRPPFEGRNFSEVLVKQATEQAPPLATLAPRVDRRLCHIIDRLLRKNPEARYQSAAALLDDLNGLGKLQSVAAPRAEGRAKPAEAPTLEMTEGQRARVGGACVPRVSPRAGDGPPTRSPKATWLAVAAVAVIAIVVGIVVLGRGPKSPDQAKSAKSSTSSPVHPSTPPPIPSPKIPPPPTPTTQHPVVVPPPKATDTPDPKVEPEPVPAPKEDAAALAKWQAIQADAKKLADAGKFDEALKALDAAKTLPLDNIADLMAESIESIQSSRSTRLKAALAAYQAESDKLWSLFKARDYAEADALLAKIVGGVSTTVGGVSTPREKDPRRGDTPPTIQTMLAADQEAAKLLKEFWSAAEKGVAARKGTISIAGALGNVTAVENGVITLQTPKEAVTRRVVDLTAKQALAYAAVAQRDDERSRLAEAIFRIAEGEDPALAERALAAAGNPPGLSCYKDRLAALTLGAAEVAARKAWAEIEAAAKPKPTKAEAARFLALLDAFEKTHAGTKHFAAVRDRLPALRAQAQPAPREPGWVGLFDGKALVGWKAVEGGAFTGRGKIAVEQGAAVLEAGRDYTGIAWTGEAPRSNYEIALEAMRVEGGRDFCDVTFPVGDAMCALVVGGLRGDLVALSVFEGQTAQTDLKGKRMAFEAGRWYAVRVRVTDERVEAWLDEEKVIDVPRAGGKFTLHPDLAPVTGLGVSAYRTKAALRNIRFRRIEPGAAEGPKKGE